MRRTAHVVAAIMSVMLSACGPAATDSSGAATRDAGATITERDYVSPPAATWAQHLNAGRILLAGTAQSLSQVRLASPTGDAMFAPVDSGGAWRVTLPSSGEVRLFGLSALRQGRPIQAEGYLAVTPRGPVAQLRAGSGAVVLGKGGVDAEILAADFDRKGGAVLSGHAPAKTLVTVLVDGLAVGAARADALGRFMLALNEPLSPGDHVVAATQAGAHNQARLTVSPPITLKAGPFSARTVAGGWRIDWLTPGGGVQSTVLYEAPETPA